MKSPSAHGGAKEQKMNTKGTNLQIIKIRQNQPLNDQSHKTNSIVCEIFPYPPLPFYYSPQGGGSKARLPKFLSLRLDRKSNSAHFCIFPKFWLAAILIRKQKNYQNYRIRPNSSAPLPNLANSASLYSFIAIPIRFLNSASFSGFAK